ncbi:C-type lectin domain family 4 member E-like, partial [Diretmus argenteus]
FELRKSPLRVAAVCLGLLGVVLLGVIIGQQVGWLKFQKSCYYSSSGKQPWKQSRQDCQQKGADLAIGLTDGGVEGKWKWVDGTPNSFNGKNQDCVEVWHSQSEKGKWNDENCNLSQRWICEM